MKKKFQTGYYLPNIPIKGREIDCQKNERDICFREDTANGYIYTPSVNTLGFCLSKLETVSLGNNIIEAEGVVQLFGCDVVNTCF